MNMPAWLRVGDGLSAMVGRAGNVGAREAAGVMTDMGTVTAGTGVVGMGTMAGGARIEGMETVAAAAGIIGTAVVLATAVTDVEAFEIVPVTMEAKTTLGVVLNPATALAGGIVPRRTTP